MNASFLLPNAQLFFGPQAPLSRFPKSYNSTMTILLI